MVATNGKRTKDLLDSVVVTGLITEDQATHVRDLHARDGRNVITVLDEEQLVDPERLALIASLHLGVSFVNLKAQQAEESAVEILPEWVCRKYGVIPLTVSDEALLVAMVDPTDIQAIDDLAAFSKRRVDAALAFARDIHESIDRSYRIGGEVANQLLKVTSTSSDHADRGAKLAAAEAIAEAPVVRAVDLLIRQAARDRASDIHIMPQEGELRVRFRIDGILHEGMTLPMSVL